MIRVREVRTVKELKRSDSLCLLIANLVQLHGNIRVRKVQWDADCRYVIGTGIGFSPFKWTFLFCDILCLQEALIDSEDF